jgi:hypothetical protein
MDSQLGGPVRQHKQYLIEIFPLTIHRAALSRFFTILLSLHPFVFHRFCKAEELRCLRKTAGSGFSSPMAAADHIYMLVIP